MQDPERDKRSDKDYFRAFVSISTDALTREPYSPKNDSFMQALFVKQGSLDDGSAYYIPTAEFSMYFNQEIAQDSFATVMRIMKRWIDIDTPEKEKYVQRALTTVHCRSCRDIRYVTYGTLLWDFWKKDAKNEELDPIAALVLQIACVCWAYRYEQNQRIAQVQQDKANVYKVNLTLT